MINSFEVLVEKACIHGWPHAMGDHYRHLDKYRMDSLYGALEILQQGAWSLFFENLSDRRVLCLDGTLGAVAIALSQAGAKVVCWQRDRNWAQAADSRIRFEGTGNITVIAGDIEGGLPFREGVFDVVCLHNETVVQSIFAQPGKWKSVSIPERLTHLVRDGGCLYISGPKASLHAKDGISRGVLFGAIKILLSHPWRLELIVEFQDSILAPYLMQARYPVERGMRYVDLFSFLLKSGYFGLILRKGVGGGFHQCLGPTPSHGNLRPKRVLKDFSGKIHIGSSGVLRLMNRDEVIRIPVIPVGRESCRANMEALLYLEKFRFPFKTPKFRECTTEFREQYREERIHGFSIDETACSLRDWVAYAESGLEKLNILYRGHAWDGIFQPCIYEKRIGEALEAVKAGLPNDFAADVDRLDAALRRRIVGRPFRHCILHGDYKPGNFIVDGHREIVGVVDWDRFDFEAPIGVDGLQMLAYIRAVRSKRRLIPALFSLQEDSAVFPILHQHFIDNDIDIQDLPFYQVVAGLYWIRNNRAFSIASETTWQESCALLVMAFKQSNNFFV